MAHFRYTIWFTISEKSITMYTFFHHGVVHAYTKSLSTNKAYKNNCVPELPILSALKNIEMNLDMLTKEKNFKTFLKENYAIDWTVATSLLKKC